MKKKPVPPYGLPFKICISMSVESSLDVVGGSSKRATANILGYCQVGAFPDDDASLDFFPDDSGVGFRASLSRRLSRWTCWALTRHFFALHFGNIRVLSAVERRHFSYINVIVTRR